MQKFKDTQNTKQLNNYDIQNYQKIQKFINVYKMRKAARWEEVKVPEKIQHEKSNQIGASKGAKRCTRSGQGVVIWENIVFFGCYL